MGGADYDKCLFGPTLSLHLHSPALFSVQLSDYFQLEKLVRQHHSVYISGPGGGPWTRFDKHMAHALGLALAESLQDRMSSTAVGNTRNTVFASGCYGHCIQEQSEFFTLRLREGIGAGLSLNDTVDVWLDGVLGLEVAPALPARLLIEK